MWHGDDDDNDDDENDDDDSRPQGSSLSLQGFLFVVSFRVLLRLAPRGQQRPSKAFRSFFKAFRFQLLVFCSQGLGFRVQGPGFKV